MRNRIEALDPSDLLRWHFSAEERESLRRLAASDDRRDKALFLRWIGKWMGWPRFSREDRAMLRELAASNDWRDRQVCVEWLKQGTAVRANAELVAELAEKLAPDRRERVYPSALHALECLIPTHPQRVWEAIERLAETRDRNLLGCLAAFLLEHLLGDYYEDYFPEVQAKIEAGDWRWATMLSSCYPMGQTPEQWSRTQALLLANRQLIRGHWQQAHPITAETP